MENGNMEKLVVIDYSDTSVNIYEIAEEDNRDTDVILESLGHTPHCCTVMWGDNIKINHKGVIEYGNN